jgi:integrase
MDDPGGVLTPLGQVLNYATRRGLIGQNPARRLERDERPVPGRREMRILDRGEIELLLSAATPSYQLVLSTAIFTGLRQGELLGLTWGDVNLEKRVLRVRKQLDRNGERVAPKTDQAMRDVVLMPALTHQLRQHKLASRFSRHADLVFTT